MKPDLKSPPTGRVIVYRACDLKEVYRGRIGILGDTDHIIEQYARNGRLDEGDYIVATVWENGSEDHNLKRYSVEPSGLRARRIS